MTIWLRSALFALGQTILILCFTLLLPLALLLPYRPRFRLLTQWNRATLWWLRITCGIQWRIHGLDHIPAGNAILLSNHQSTWETLLLPLLFAPQTWVLKRELLRIPLFGWGLALARPIAIDRGAGRKAIRQLVEQGRQRLDDGIWVVIFPEGTRVAPGKRKPFAIGGALLAEQSGYPVIPIAHNAGHCWPRHSFRKYPGSIDLVVGPVIDSHGRKASEINRLAEEWITRTRIELGDLTPVQSTTNSGTMEQNS